ncbi:MAG: hypothetical protein J6C62_02170 [Clostridia bacterium]|nr:hypothetical protein [Clostridia bacterium]
MKYEPKILVFTVNSWNSLLGDNTWASLLLEYKNTNVANIYIREERPDSNACDNYFCISEEKIIKSVFKRKTKTGTRVFRVNQETEQTETQKKHNERYHKMKQKRRYSMLFARELVWKIGKWKTKELNEFLDEFKPNIILYSFEGYIHLNRIVRYAIKRTGAKAIGYIWDDNFTYKQSRKLGYKFYRFFQRKSLKKLAKQTQEFFAIAPKTKQEADRFFGINCTVLSKPLNAQPQAETYIDLQKPLKMLYTGNLLIGRDQTLYKISRALKELNKNQIEIVLDVYTQTELSSENLKLLQHDSCKVHSAIPQSEVLVKQKEADTLLFLEDLSDKNLMARLSFSTKITDYFSTGKCIFAVGNSDLAPIQYFKDTKSAIVIDKEADILIGLSHLLSAENLANYAKNAVRCGNINHGAEHINKTFSSVINRVYSE